MKKTVFSILVSACAAALSPLFADAYSDFKSYRPGDSLAWFYELRGDSSFAAKAPVIEGRLLSIISEGKISDAAFDRACEILKPIATERCVPVLEKFLGDDFRTPWVCSVFITLDSSDADKALVSALEKAGTKCRMDMISTLAARGSSEGFEAVKKYADSPDRELALFAVASLVNFVDDDSVEFLRDVAMKNDFRRQSALFALSMIAYRSAKNGEKSLAKDALECVPEDFGMSIGARAELEGKNRVKYLDSIIIADGENVEKAGRLIYNARRFDDSAEILAAFPKLSKRAKLAAMGTFMLSGDTRFYPVVAPLLDSDDADLRDEAVYMARYICTDEANLRKLYSMLEDSDKIVASHVRNVFDENPSFAAARILKEKADGGDYEALSFLIRRGDEDAWNRLENEYFGGGYKDAKISKMVENLITFGKLRAFVSRMRGAEEALRSDIAKIVVKKLAKSRDKMFVSEAAYEILKDNLSPDEKEYKFIVSKLKTKPMKRKDVWQNEYRQRAVEDSLMKVAEEREPELNDGGFSSMFDGKTLDGWRTSTGNAAYSVKDGCIYGVTDPKMKQNSFLVTERSDYENFIFTCEFKWEEFGNSGVIFRGQIQKTEDSGKNGSSADAARLGYKIVGPQAEMDDNPKRRWSAGIYNEGAEWKYSLSRKDHENARNAVCLDGWNRMTIKCVGDRIQTWLNGVPVSDLIWKGTKPGFFGLQVHMGKTGKILWRNLKIKELK